MTLSRANPAGWALNEIFTSAQANAMDIEITKALDGDGGGSYSPTTVLRVAGEGFGISSLFDSEGMSAIFALQNWSGNEDSCPAGLDTRGFAWSSEDAAWLTTGNSDEMAVSNDDGLHWIDSNTGMGAGINLEDVANSRGFNRYIAVGDSDVVYYVQGIGAWTTSAGGASLPGSADTGLSIVYDDSNNLFIVVGFETGPEPYVATTPGNAIPAWTERSAGIPASYDGAGIDCIAVNESGTSIISQTGVNQTKLLFSTDAVTWAESTTSLVSDRYSVGYNPGVDKFLAFGIVSNNIYTSADGDTWTLQDTAAGILTGTPAQASKMVGSLGRIWVIGGENNNIAHIMYSEDDFVNPAGWRNHSVSPAQGGMTAMGYAKDGINGKVMIGLVQLPANSSVYGSIRCSAQKIG